MRTRARLLTWLLVAGTLLTGCTGLTEAVGPRMSSVSSRSINEPRPRRTRSSVDSDKRLLVVEGALSLVGAEVLTVGGKTFPYDCTGLVRAAYWYAGIDIAQDFSQFAGNGVSRIYQTLDERGMLYVATLPQAGDIVFWDNTYDRNEDGKWNDPLTHVGVIVSVQPGGQIEYVHANYRKGIVPEYLNLR